MAVNFCIDVLKAVAVLLILNSHMKGVYPSDIVSFGGGFGLAVFYTVSGYLLSKKPITCIKSWYLKKIMRLYIPIWIYGGFRVLTGIRQIYSVTEFIHVFVFPTYWFVASMVILYLVYYFVVGRINQNKNIINHILYVCLVAYTILYFCNIKFCFLSLESLEIEGRGVETPYIIMLLIWFVCMLNGVRMRTLQGKIKSTSPREFILLAVSVLLFLIVKLISQRYIQQLEILLGIIYIVFADSLFKVAFGCEKILQKESNGIIGKFICLLSRASLEIYLVQIVIIRSFRDFIFPVNWVIICCLTIVAGFVLQKLSGVVYRKIGGKLNG